MKKRRNNKSSPKADDSSTNTERLMRRLKEWRRNIGYYSIFAAVPAMIAGSSPELKAEDAAVDSQITPTKMGNQATRRVRRPGLVGARAQDPQKSKNVFLSASNISGSDACPGTPIPAGSYTAATPYVDSGDTTGANNTVTTVWNYGYYYYYYYYSASGPDKIYSFVVAGTGDAAQITVTTTSPTYRPMIYVSSGCPAGESQYLYSTIINDSRWGSGNSATVDLSNLNLGQRYYVFVDSQMTGDGGAYTMTLKDMQISAAVPVRTNRPDFDGDGRTDISVYRPNDATWYIDRSSQGVSTTQFGISTDQIVPEDYDGDGKTDIAVFRNGEWWILKSSDSTPLVGNFGQVGDIPVPADYTGDGRSEIAVFREGQWWMLNLVNGESSVVNFGQAGDIPVPGDVTRDGRTDLGIFRSGQWWRYNLANGQYDVINYGQAGDRPVLGDWDGDGHADPAVYRDGTWYLSHSGSSHAFQWGLPTDVPTPGDYDGDGRTDMAIFRDGVWWIMQTSNGQPVVRQFGLGGDTPAPGANVR